MMKKLAWPLYRRILSRVKRRTGGLPRLGGCPNLHLYLLCCRILHMRRDFVILYPADKPSFLKISKCSSQHRVGDAGDRFFQLAKSHPLISSKFKENPCVPLPLKYLHRLVDGAIHNKFFFPHYNNCVKKNQSAEMRKSKQ